MGNVSKNPSGHVEKEFHQFQSEVGLLCLGLRLGTRKGTYLAQKRSQLYGHGSRYVGKKEKKEEG